MEDLILSSIDSEVRVVALEIIKTQFPNRWQQMDFNHKNGLPRKGLVLPHNKKVLFWSKITVLLFLTEIGPFFYKKLCSIVFWNIWKTMATVMVKWSACSPSIGQTSLNTTEVYKFFTNLLLKRKDYYKQKRSGLAHLKIRF